MPEESQQHYARQEATFSAFSKSPAALMLADCMSAAVLDMRDALNSGRPVDPRLEATTAHSALYRALAYAVDGADVPNDTPPAVRNALRAASEVMLVADREYSAAANAVMQNNGGTTLQTTFTAKWQDAEGEQE